jgi:hypothetical protein
MNTKKKLDLVRQIRDEINIITDQYDSLFCEYFDLEDTGILEDSEDEIIKNFLENYSSKSVGITEHDHLSAQELLDMFGRDAILAAIMKASTTEAVDYYIQWNEMYSIQCGEYEHQIDVKDHPDLNTLIDQATDAELNQAGVSDRECFLAYGHPADRFILKLDPELYLIKISELSEQEPASIKPKLTLAYSRPLTMHEMLLARIKQAKELEAKRKMERNK